MLEKLTQRAIQRAERLRRDTIDRLAVRPLPPGVRAEPTEGGVRLSGRGLKRRMIDDAVLRNFTK